MQTTYPRIAVIHHLQQPFLGHAAAPLGAVEEHFGTLPELDGLDGIVSFGGEDSSWEPQFAAELELIREAVRVGAQRLEDRQLSDGPHPDAGGHARIHDHHATGSHLELEQLRHLSQQPRQTLDRCLAVGN